MTSIGTISELWRYPVKSMLGERCEVLRVDARGVEGDRLFALSNGQGKLGSGKNTRRFRKMDGLFGFRASYRDGVARIQFPSGQILPCDAAAVQQLLAEALGEPVVLAREGAVSHLDAGPVHLITSASLAWLRAALPEATIDARRFRPNLVIEVPGVGLVEQAWLGKRLCVGGEVELAVAAATERCAMVTFAQDELPAEPSVLRHIAQRAARSFGVYAQVVVPGTVRLDDAVAFKDDDEG